VSGEGEGVSGWVLPEHLQKSTGIVYATSFPALDTAISEVTSFFKSKSPENEDILKVIDILRSRFQAFIGSSSLSAETEKAFQDLASAAAAISEQDFETPAYEFDRKFLFRVLVLGNAQLAQIVHARGPNMQTNAACAGSTQAVALAHDMIQLGRAERMIVIAGDNASSDTLMPWVGNGFRALGAASIASDVKEAARPFGKDRNGLVLGSGGIGMVLESEDGARRRFALALKNNDLSLSSRSAFKCRILGTLYSNSAFHGAALDRAHIAEEMERFITTIEKEQGIARAEIARYGAYFSHETSTNASPSASCASNELYGLRKVFGRDFKHLVILNTKGFTGHPMGVSFEDVVAVEVLRTGVIPPIANLAEVDPYLGSDLNLSKGGTYPCKFAIRFAAGFGSQIALAMYGSIDT
jgi:3-oxoacyl-(acyl-carrier-protein) synthase